MKYVWEEEDLVYGSWVCRKPPHNFSVIGVDMGWHAKWCKMIGYSGGSANGSRLICIADGLVFPRKTKAEMCEYLTKYEMQPCPAEWLDKIRNYIGHNKR